jgi:DNA-binding transcriptional LysR family regulator
MNLNKIKEFYYVARAENITKAAQQLNISQPAISRSMQIFEYQLGCKLFVRCPRGLKLTEQGERVYEFACRVIEEAHLIGKTIKVNALEGDLLIAISPYLSGSWLIKKLKNYLSFHSEIRLKILDQLNYLKPGEFDVLIDFDVLTGSAIKHVLLKSNMGLFASPAYLKKFGTPQQLDDLDKHQLISYSEHSKFPYNAKEPWLLKVGKNYGNHRRPYLKVPSLEGLLSAASEDLGIVELPRDLREIKERGLVPVCANMIGPEIEISFTYPNELKERANIHSLKDYLLDGSVI